MNNPLNQARICQSPVPWHPWPDVDRMLGATDLAARSVLVLLLTDPHCSRPNWYCVPKLVYLRWNHTVSAQFRAYATLNATVKVVFYGSVTTYLGTLNLGRRKIYYRRDRRDRGGTDIWDLLYALRVLRG